MKKTTKFFAIAIVALSFSAATFGQVSATASATATIITPIAISKTVDMNFGNVAVNASAGTVILAPAGTRTRTGGCTLPAVTGTVTAASFGVTGLATATFAITLPGSITITDGTNNMTVDTFTSNPSVTGTVPATLTVGATLNVSGGQVPGVYTTASPFTVTVNYN
jgi:hypothetical protein